MTEYGTTVLVATHLMPEAELCGRLMLLDRGVSIADGTPVELQNRLSGERLTVRLVSPAESQKQIESSLNLSGVLEGDRLILRVTRPAEQVSAILSQFANQILSLEFTKPSLEDVFMELTGHSFEAEETGP
jgi:ABC-2 type transport system ATP-binding protein